MRAVLLRLRRDRRLKHRQFQATWALLHASAAWLAATACVMHIGSAVYHLRRMGDDDA